MTSQIFVNQFCKFALIGIVITLINYALFYVLFAFMGVPYVIASGVGFLVGVFIGYPLNKNWTYQNHKKTTVVAGFKYAGVYSVSLCLGIALLIGLVKAGMDARMANCAAIILTTCTNFIGTKFMVFKA